MDYLKILLIGITIILLVYNYTKFRKLFIEKDGSFCFRNFKKNTKLRNSFIYIIIIESILIFMIYFFVFNDQPKNKTTKPISTFEKERYIFENVSDEKTEDELDREIRNSKSNYELMNSKGENRDSILKLEYEKALEDLRKSEENFK